MKASFNELYASKTLSNARLKLSEFLLFHTTGGCDLLSSFLFPHEYSANKNDAAIIVDAFIFIRNRLPQI